MPQSMTGYGRGDITLHNRRFYVEVKSVNHRYNEITIRAPRTLNSFENDVRKMVADTVKRGKTEVYISLFNLSADDIKVSVNIPLAKAYVDAVNEIKSAVCVSGAISIDMLARFPDIINIDKDAQNEEKNAEIWEGLSQAVTQALECLFKMRKREGDTLTYDITQKLAKIENDTESVARIAPLVNKNYKTALRERIENALAGAVFDESRFLMEITLFADKACIDEEITRLKSHISQMRDMLTKDGAIGRGLDFITQEMNREINTISAKANNLDITQISVDIKTELERIREQVQNIE